MSMESSCTPSTDSSSMTDWSMPSTVRRLPSNIDLTRDAIDNRAHSSVITWAQSGMTRRGHRSGFLGRPKPPSTPLPERVADQ